MSEWRRVKLSECCQSIADGDHQPPPKAETGIPFVTISNMTSTNQFDFCDTLFVPQQYYDSLDDKRKAKKNDILYSVVGSFGIPVFMKEDKEFVFQRHIAILRPNEEEIVPRFLFYTMLTRNFYAKADAAAIGAAQRTVSLTALRNMEIDIPEKEQQCRIVEILSAYDDLIENNQKQIRLLEEAAQRLYKEWFVDLHFPGYEEAHIVYGIPEGWRREKIGDLFTTVLGGTPSRDKAEYWGGSIPWINSGEVNKLRIKYFKKLLKECGLPDIRWHDLRSTYCTLLLKNDFSPKAVSVLMGHAKEIITVDVYGDNQGIIVDGVPELEAFIKEVIPGEALDSINDLSDVVIDTSKYLSDE